MSKRASQRNIRRILSSFAVFAISAVICVAVFLCVNAEGAMEAAKALLLSGFIPGKGLQKTLLYWPLLTLTGLSVGFAWKAGYYNMGAPGQFTVGALLAMTAGLLFSLPWWVCFTAAAIGGVAWGALAAMLKPRFLLKEVLSGVTLNYLAMYLTQWVWEDVLSVKGESASLNQSLIPMLPTGEELSIHLGIPIALSLCLLLWIVMRYAVIGYEIRAGGSNLEAAKQAGMPVERNVTLAVVLCGGLSGLAGGMCLLSGMTDTALSTVSTQMGFIGIPIAMLSLCHPLGTVFTALAAAGICSGSGELSSAFPQETGQILFGFALLMAAVLYGKRKEKHSR